ncbi:hypothetical protein B0J17DRAFT_685092 [Rhizoctonia solani]|nr:hypothetical protein B0J17DRAFT_685092 [Rhizoctonia solani]
MGLPIPWPPAFCHKSYSSPVLSGSSLALSRFSKLFRSHSSIHARLNQAILGHVFFGEYRERFRPDSDTSISCGQPRQTLDHVLCDCLLHTEACGTLRKVSSPLS